MNEPGSVMPKRSRAWGLALLGLGSLVALGYTAGVIVSRSSTPKPVPPALQATLWPEPRPLPDFELNGSGGAPFNPARLQGRWTLLFFGYTHCPDICPVALAAIAQTVAELKRQEPDATVPQVVFVSVDPDRDSLSKLGAYVGHFNPDFLGATGDEEDLRAFAQKLGVLWFRVREQGAAHEAYLITHTSSILVVDPEVRLYARFSLPHDGRAMAQKFRDVRRHYAAG